MELHAVIPGFNDAVPMKSKAKAKKKSMPMPKKPVKKAARGR